MTEIGKNSSRWVHHHFPLIRGELTPFIGPSILKKVKEAIPECNDHQQDFEELTQSLMLKFLAQLTSWKQQVEEWEGDSTKPNPFEVRNDGAYGLD